MENAPGNTPEDTKSKNTKHLHNFYTTFTQLLNNFYTNCYTTFTQLLHRFCTTCRTCYRQSQSAPGPSPALHSASTFGPSVNHRGYCPRQGSASSPRSAPVLLGAFALVSCRFACADHARCALDWRANGRQGRDGRFSALARNSRSICSRARARQLRFYPFLYMSTP